MPSTTGVDSPPPFTADASLREWEVPARTWLAQKDESKKLDGLASACAVFNGSGSLLVVQRAAHDSLPGRWELPGGGVDEEDATVLEGAARELREEAGLVAAHFEHVLTEGPDCAPGCVFPNSTKTKTWCRFAFAVHVRDTDVVTLDPNEHQDYAWASEAEIREQRSAGRELPITTESMRAVMLEAFRLRK